MPEKLEDVFAALQELDIKSTPNNTSIMCGVYNVLREIYKELTEKKEGAKDDGSADSI